MTKAKIRKCNIIAFVVLSIIIILMGFLVSLYCHKKITAPTVDLDEVISKKQTAELWEVLPVVEGVKNTPITVVVLLMELAVVIALRLTVFKIKQEKQIIEENV